jgi:DNA-dependent RNA polymerase auxiliary subunit epsilon
MNKYLVTIHFEWSERTMEIIPEHRAYINELIEQQVLEHYAVSMETQSLWITINAESKTAVRKLLSASPFYPFWTLEVNELIIWDGQNYRLPVMQLN